MRQLAALLAMTAVLAACSGEESVEAVATAAGVPITTGEFAEAYATFIVQAGLQTDQPEAREAVVQSLVNRRLMIEAAKDEGIEDEEAYRQARQLAEAKVLIDLYTAQEKADVLEVTEVDLREQFVRTHTTYRARHLYARDQASAERLRERLRAGETFEALARETFADPHLASTGGDLGEFGHDEMDPALEAAAFGLAIGEVSEPVRTGTGWSVLRVDARATSPLLTESEFNRKRDNLARYVRKWKRTEARFTLSREVRDALAPRFEVEAFDQLVAFATGRAPGLDDEALTEWHRQPLVRFSSDHMGNVWTVGEVEGRAASMTERQRAAVQDAASLKEFIEGLLVRDELVARARANGLDQDARFTRAVARRMDDWVFSEAKRRLRLVDDVPEDTLRAHFAANADAYQLPERVRAREILVATKAEADVILRDLQAGDDFGDLARQHSLRPGAAQADGSLGAVTRGQLGRLASSVFAAAPGAIVGPMEVQGRYVLIERGDTLPARPMTYAEARPLLRQALDAPFAERRLEAVVAAFRDRYSVQIDRAALGRVLTTSAVTAQRGRPSRPDRS